MVKENDVKIRHKSLLLLSFAILGVWRYLLDICDSNARGHTEDNERTLHVLKSNIGF